ncbi:hypothetical protein LMH81_29680, partial [Vibrio lentus]|uniref:hypothetical protein n=1 Tax=Vibrio lentus TaxID=136468 RepID=UPI001E40E240
SYLDSVSPIHLNQSNPSKLTSLFLPILPPKSHSNARHNPLTLARYCNRAMEERATTYRMSKAKNIDHRTFHKKGRTVSHHGLNLAPRLARMRERSE